MSSKLYDGHAARACSFCSALREHRACSARLQSLQRAARTSCAQRALAVSATRSARLQSLQRAARTSYNFLARKCTRARERIRIRIYASVRPLERVCIRARDIYARGLKTGASMRRSFVLTDEPARLQSICFQGCVATSLLDCFKEDRRIGCVGRILPAERTFWCHQ